MPSNLTNSEIKKAFECCYTDKGGCDECPYYSREENRCIEDGDFFDLPNRILDLINQYETKNSNLTSDLTSLQNDLTSAKAEIEKLQNAYKQCAWERDVFAEDMTQEIKKDCSYLMLDIKTIKDEAYKEFDNNIEKAFSKTENQMPDNKVVKQTVQICRNAIRLVLNELMGDNNE